MTSFPYLFQLPYTSRVHQALLPFHPMVFGPQSRLISVSLRKQCPCYTLTVNSTLEHATKRGGGEVPVGAGEVFTAEELKVQLEALQREAEQVRARASSARSRFMRLTEAAEKLRTRAAFDVKYEREDSARQMLSEKQKVMKALQNSKRRVEVLEELSTKLAEAISTKETQLIAALSCGRLKMGTDDNTGDAKTIRIVSPSGEARGADDTQTGHRNNLGGDTSESSSSDDSVHDEDSEVDYNSHCNNEPEKQNVVNLFGPHNYSRFLTEIDCQLDGLELKIQDFMYFATMVLEEPVEAAVNNRVFTMKQIWLDIQNLRSRIHQASKDGKI